MVVIGDSIMQALATAGTTGSTPTTARWYNTLSSIYDWANVATGGRVLIPQGGNKAIGGQSSSQIAARFTTDLSPLNPGIILANGGVNDNPGTVTAAAILANWDSMIAQASAMGAYLIIQPVLPASSFTAVETARAAAVNAGLAARASSTVRIVDVSGFDFQTMCYPENGAFGPAGVKIHPNIIGARFLGARVASILNSLVTAGSPLLEPGDPTNLFPFGTMAGTGGSPDGSASGTVASGWALWGAGSGGATVVGSKVADAGGDWQQVAISGTYTGNSRVVELTSGFDFAGGLADEQFELTLELMLQGAVKIDAVSALIYIYNSDYSVNTFASQFQNNVANGSGGFDAPDFTGTLRVMPVSMPGVAPLHGRVFITAQLREGGLATPVGGTFRVRKVGFKKFAAPFTPVVLYQTDFSTATGWTLNTDVTISGGLLRFTSTAAAFRTASRAPGHTPGQKYNIIVDPNVVSGDFRVVLGGTPSAYYSGSGAPITIPITAGAGSLLELQTPASGSNVTVDNLRVETAP